MDLNEQPHLVVDDKYNASSADQDKFIRGGGGSMDLKHSEQSIKIQAA